MMLMRRAANFMKYFAVLLKEAGLIVQCLGNIHNALSLYRRFKQFQQILTVLASAERNRNISSRYVADVEPSSESSILSEPYRLLLLLCRINFVVPHINI